MRFLRGLVTGKTIFQWQAYSESLEAESPSARNPRLFVVHGSGEALELGWINGAQGLMFRKPQNHQVLLEVFFKDCRLSWLRKWDDELEVRDRTPGCWATMQDSANRHFKTCVSQVELRNLQATYHVNSQIVEASGRQKSFWVLTKQHRSWRRRVVFAECVPPLKFAIRQVTFRHVGVDMKRTD